MQDSSEGIIQLGKILAQLGTIVILLLCAGTTQVGFDHGHTGASGKSIALKARMVEEWELQKCKSGLIKKAFRNAKERKYTPIRSRVYIRGCASRNTLSDS